MTNDLYLVDNNILAKLTREQRAAPFLRECCFVTQDVVHEARGFGDEVADVPVRSVTRAVLQRLQEVMAQVPPGDTSLVNLYANKGSADPVLIATALVMKDEEQQTLWPRNIVVVSADRAVTRMAERLHVDHIGFDHFARLTTGASAGEGP